MPEILLIAMQILNIYLLFYTRKNIYTWYLYHWIGGILPLIQIVTKKKRESTKFYLLRVIILYTISIFFFSVALIWILMKDIFKIWSK